MSTQKSKQGTLIGVFQPSSNKFELYDSEMSKFALYVYQLLPGTKHIHLLDKFTIVSRSDGSSGSIISVISNYIAGTPTNTQCNFFTFIE